MDDLEMREAFKEMKPLIDELVWVHVA